MYNYFEYKKRFKRDETADDSYFYCMKDGRPDGLYDLVHEIHGDMLPDDYKYDFIATAFSAIADGYTEDSAHEAMAADVSYWEVAQWHASHSDRREYANDNAYNTPESTIEEMQSNGQYTEKMEVFYAVSSWIDSELEAIEDDDEE